MEGLLYQINAFNSECEKLNKELEKGNISHDELEEVCSLIQNHLIKTESVTNGIVDFEEKFKSSLEIDNKINDDDHQNYEETKLSEALSEIFVDMSYLKGLSNKCTEKVRSLGINY